MIYDSSVIAEPPVLDSAITAIGIPCSEIALSLGTVKVKNVVALGALQAATQLFPKDSLLTSIRQALAKDCTMTEINEEAFNSGINAFEENSGTN